jgi:hypothetical protein
VSFGWGSVILGLCDDDNGHVVNIVEREHTIAPMLKLPIEIIGYVACTDTSRQGGDAPLCNGKDVTYATCQLWIISSVVLFMIQSW